MRMYIEKWTQNARNMPTYFNELIVHILLFEVP